MSNHSLFTKYLPLDYGQIHEQGALCHLMGTYGWTYGGVTVLHGATVAYEDAAGRVHAGRFEHLSCRVADIGRARPGDMLKIVAEMSFMRDGPFYEGVLHDSQTPAFDLDPASRVDCRNFRISIRTRP